MAAQDNMFKPRVLYPVKQGVSRPVRAMKAPLRPAVTGQEERELWIGYPQKRGARPPLRLEAPEPDRAVQQTAPVAAMPAATVNFEGLSNLSGVYPPDTCGDVGPNHYVQITNFSFRVFDKAGTPLTPALANNTLWAGFGGVCETTNHGDPIVLYDQFADRWLLSQFSITGPFHQCIAVSQTGDPTGSWHLYDFQMSTTVMNDYPKFGVWSDGYYMAINQFVETSPNVWNWAGQGAVVFDRSAMLSGSPAAMVYFDLVANTALGAMLPADADGMTAPPAGTPNYFVQFDDNPADQLQIYEFHADWATPANSTFSKAAESPLAVAPFTTLVRTTVPQPGTTQKLDNLGDRLMYRLQYRNFGSHQSMVVNHTVDTTGTGTGVAGIRWYELRDSGAGWIIQQQATYAGDAPNTEHRWMGSLAMDGQGNLALGYSVASAATYPSIRYAGRLAGDTANTLGQGEAEIIAGTGSQTGSAARWGDYSMMSVDPVDDCTFWYTQEYYQTTSNTGWQTRVAAFKFPGCTAGPSGRLEGTVSNAGALPLAGATVTVDDGGGIQLATTTGADGSYAFASLPAGNYTVTAAKFGYVPASVPAVAIVDGATTTQDFVLTSATLHTLSGTVTDAATGWPLYAEVNYGPASVWTNPATGSYSVDLPEGDYALQVSAFVAGYDQANRSITLNADRTEDFGLTVSYPCSVDGYAVSSPPPALIAESFDGCALPAGWTINNLGTDCDWVISDPDPGSDGNLTGGSGCFADADADACGSGTTDMDTELITPAIDCSSLASVALEFKYDIYTYSGTDTFAVDVSVDGGTTWTNVFQRFGVSDRGPKTTLLDISGIAAGQADVRARFHYIAPAWEYWWQVDDVRIIPSLGCTPPVAGGFVVGRVADANTGLAVVGALVDDGAGHTATTVATPDDPSLGDGFYSLYLPTSGLQDLTASKAGYGPVTAAVSVPALGTATHDFSLPAGRLSADPAAVEVHVALSGTAAAALSLNNDGSLAADFALLEVDAPPPAGPNGPFAVPVRHMSPKHLDERDASGARFDYPVPGVPVVAAAGEVLRTWDSGLAYPWGIGHQNGTGNIWLGNISAGGGDDVTYEYDAAGVLTGRTLDVSAIPQVFMADIAYDWLNATLWQVNVGGDDCIHELDPATLTVTGNRICPAFGVSQRGLAYNPKTDTFYAGSWNDSTIHEFDRNGTILRSTNVGLGIAGLAFNPVTDHLFVLVNGLAANPEIYVVTVPASGDFTVAGQFDIPIFVNNYSSAGLAMGCDGHLWAVDKSTGNVHEVDSGETGTCSLDIPWLTVTPQSGTVAAAGGQPVTLDVNATGYGVGSHPGFLRVKNQTPYGNPIVPVTMVVEPDQLLSVAKDGSGSGTVLADSGPVNCGATCSGDYPYNTIVTLTATAAPGSTFMGWTGDCTGNGVCTVTMNQARNVTATFTDTSVATRNLDVSVTGNGSGGVTSAPVGIFCGMAGSTCSAPFDDTVSVTLTAAAATGSTFTGWTGDCSGTGACIVTMEQARSVTATFTLIQYTVTATADGTGAGTVVSDLGGISYSYPGQAMGTTVPIDHGSSVTLIATAAAGSTVSWSGCPATGGTASAATCTFSGLDGDKTAAATFTLQSFALSVSKAGKGDGQVRSSPAGIDCGGDCSEPYAYGTRVVLTATPDRHSALAGWQGSCSEAVTEPPAPTCTVDIEQAEEITVLFDHVFPWPMFLPAVTGGSR